MEPASCRYPVEKEHYEREGYAIFREVIDLDLVEEARRHIAWLLEHNPGVNRYNPKPRYIEGEHMRFRGCEAWT